MTIVMSFCPDQSNGKQQTSQHYIKYIQQALQSCWCSPCYLNIAFICLGSGIPRRELAPLQLAYDLRNGRMHQNMVFSTKIMTNFLGRWPCPLPRPSPSGQGYPLPTSHPPRHLQDFDPSHSKIMGMPLCLGILYGLKVQFYQLQKLL